MPFRHWTLLDLLVDLPGSIAKALGSWYPVVRYRDSPRSAYVWDWRVRILKFFLLPWWLATNGHATLTHRAMILPTHSQKKNILGDVSGLQNQWLYYVFVSENFPLETMAAERFFSPVFGLSCGRPLVWDWPVCSLEPCAARHYPLVNIQKTMENHH